MKNLKGILVAVLLLSSLSIHADEGMWMIQDINAALEKNMKARGLMLSAKEIYNADAPGTSVADAVVSLGFYCTGSLLSDKGLIITNHHCAYSNIAKLSTPEHNYLEEGFWAMSSEDEIPVEGESVYFLKRVFDVTDEVEEMKNAGRLDIQSQLVRKYSESTGLTCIFSNMWAGERSYISAYKVYTDVRLVAAPPVCIGYFGGETDNWTWPRQNCDFAMYRIYENDLPVSCEKSLRISLEGYTAGSFAMVIGYPGRTDRYASSAEIEYQEEVALPASNELRGSQMKIISRWMNADPAVRMKYSDWYFGLSNTQENNVGMAACYKRFRVRDEKLAQEREMQEWIDSSPGRKERWGTLIPDLKAAYSLIADGEQDKVYFRETILRGTFISRYILRASNSKTLEQAKEHLLAGIAETDPRVEKDLLEYALREYFTNQDSYYFGPYQKRIQARFGYDFRAMAEYLWDRSLVSSKSKVEAMEALEEMDNDPLRKFLEDARISAYNDRNGHQDKRNRATELENEYKRALYWMRLNKGVLQYPDANSTMRISYGRVGGFEPNDGVWYNWYSTPDGILQKYDPANGMIVDFLTDNDIAGGNSGSPVLNANGDLIGLAFDGNLESLASDTSYTQGYNKCINTDIRFVLWVLDRYAGMKRILKELEFS